MTRILFDKIQCLSERKVECSVNYCFILISKWKKHPSLCHGSLYVCNASWLQKFVLSLCQRITEYSILTIRQESVKIQAMSLRVCIDRAICVYLVMWLFKSYSRCFYKNTVACKYYFRLLPLQKIIVWCGHTALHLDYVPLQISWWHRPEVFRSLTADSQKMMSFERAEEMESESVTSEDEGLPPLEPNTNRRRPQQLERDESDSTSSSD